MAPDEFLRPLWRCEPNHGSGVFAIALDPKEAAFVLDRGWATLDGVRYRVNLYGCSGDIDGDGRIMVRCEIADNAASQLLHEEAESLRRLTYNETVEEDAWVD